MQPTARVIVRAAADAERWADHWRTITMVASMSGTAVLLRAFDDTWKHHAESIRAVLSGVTEEEASWQHHSYMHEIAVPGLPAPGTILWHLAHLEHCARHYAAVLGTRPLEEEPATPRPQKDYWGNCLPASSSLVANYVARLNPLPIET